MTTDPVEAFVRAWHLQEQIDCLDEGDPVQALTRRILLTAQEEYRAVVLDALPEIFNDVLDMFELQDD